MENSKRFDNLDLMKALGILMVISLHVPLWNPDFMNQYDISHIVQYMCRIISEGVPIFVTINGFLLLKKTEFNIQKHIFKMLKMVGLIFVWGIILAIAGLALDVNRAGFGIWDVFYAVLNIQVGANYTGVLWFLQNLLGVYLVFPILWYVYTNNYKLYQYLFIIVSMFVPGLGTVVLIRDALATVIDTSLLSTLIDFINRFNPIGNGWYLFYFMLGGIIWNRLEWIQRNRVFLSFMGVLSWPLAFSVGFYISKATGVTYNPAFNYGSVFMICFLVGFFAFTLPIKCNCVFMKILCSVGKNTFGMYLSHFLFIFIVNNRYRLESARDHLAAFFVVCISSYLFSIIMSKIPRASRIIEL